jgi:hypothetical protein
MGWFSRKKGGGEKNAGTAPPPGPPGEGTAQKSPGSPAKPSRADIHAQAMEKVRQARASIGPEALDKIAAAMQKKQASAIEQAKDKIRALDKADLATALKDLIDEKK